MVSLINCAAAAADDDDDVDRDRLAAGFMDISAYRKNRNKVCRTDNVT